MTAEARLIVVLVAVAVTGCSVGAGSNSARSSTPLTTPPPPGSVSSTAPDTPPPPYAAPHPEEPVPSELLDDAPTALGALFETADDPLPAELTGALHSAGGEALPVTDALTRFGVFGVPRPSGSSSAVMELTSSGSLLAEGSSLNAEVVYLVSSATSIEQLLETAAAAASAPGGVSGPPTSVADYDGTTGDPRCASIELDWGPLTTASVEGCEYRDRGLTALRSIGVRRLGLPVRGLLVAPAVFADVPAELLAAGVIESFSATFGRPTGPAGDTIRLELTVRLTGSMPAQSDRWQSDGPNRWWRDDAVITLDAGLARWSSSMRAQA